MLPTIYVDGQEGTTGIRIHEYLAPRDGGDMQVLKIDPEKRKDPAERRKLLNAADIVFLCLPDAASREAVALIDNPGTRVIDASTAFRTDPEWAYGLPELSPEHREKIRTSRRVANPGCHATAFLLSVYPLIQQGIIAPTMPLTCVSLTGYSGAGKKMIARYEAPDAPEKFKGPRPYALKLAHKHLPEMQKIAGLTQPPLFTPVIVNVHSGLAVETFLPVSLLAKPVSASQAHEALAEWYGTKGKSPFVRVMPFDPEAQLDEGCLDITACNNTNRADVFVFGNSAQIAVITRLDNLGKGAAGAAVQSMNLMLGLPEETGLRV